MSGIPIDTKPGNVLQDDSPPRHHVHNSNDPIPGSYPDQQPAEVEQRSEEAALRTQGHNAFNSTVTDAKPRDVPQDDGPPHHRVHNSNGPLLGSHVDQQPTEVQQRSDNDLSQSAQGHDAFNSTDAKPRDVPQDDGRHHHRVDNSNGPLLGSHIDQHPAEVQQRFDNDLSQKEAALRAQGHDASNSTDAKPRNVPQDDGPPHHRVHNSTDAKPRNVHHNDGPPHHRVHNSNGPLGSHVDQQPAEVQQRADNDLSQKEAALRAQGHNAFNSERPLDVHPIRAGR